MQHTKGTCQLPDSRLIILDFSYYGGGRIYCSQKNTYNLNVDLISLAITTLIKGTECLIYCCGIIHNVIYEQEICFIEKELKQEHKHTQFIGFVPYYPNTKE